MKHRPFIEIIDFNAELKEYKYLCRRKSKKFTYYLDWKKHMFSLIEKFEDKNDLENFKYFCRNRERSTRSTASTYLSLIIMFATVCIDNFIVDNRFRVLKYNKIEIVNKDIIDIEDNGNYEIDKSEIVISNKEKNSRIIKW